MMDAHTGSHANCSTKSHASSHTGSAVGDGNGKGDDQAKALGQRIGAKRIQRLHAELHAEVEPEVAPSGAQGESASKAIAAGFQVVFAQAKDNTFRRAFSLSQLGEGSRGTSLWRVELDLHGLTLHSNADKTLKSLDNSTFWGDRGV